MGRGFLWERPLHTSGQQGRAALALCKQSPSNNGIGKKDPVAGMQNWEIKIEGLQRKFKGSYPTKLVLFKVQNDLVAKNISDQNFTIDGKQFKIRKYLEATSFRSTRCQELGSHA